MLLFNAIYSQMIFSKFRGRAADRYVIEGIRAHPIFRRCEHRDLHRETCLFVCRRVVSSVTSMYDRALLAATHHLYVKFTQKYDL